MIRLSALSDGTQASDRRNEVAMSEVLPRSAEVTLTGCLSMTKVRASPRYEGAALLTACGERCQRLLQLDRLTSNASGTARSENKSRMSSMRSVGVSTVGSEAARAPISCRDRPYQERPADMARLQMRVGIPESMKS